MSKLRVFTILIALLLAGGEVARWWGNPRFLPLAFDELLVGAALLAAGLGARRYGASLLAGAWGLFCGLALALLVPTLDHLLFGPPKESGAVFYSVILSIMFAVGLASLWMSLRLARRERRGVPPPAR